MKYFKIPTIDNLDIEFRTISAEEADRFYFALKQESNPYLEEYIFNLITDNKYADKDLSAGTIPLIVYTSFKLSGVILKKEQFPDEIDNIRKTLTSNTYYPIYAKIVSTQPNYRLDELKLKTLNELLELLAFAEMVDHQPLIDTTKLREHIKQENVKSNPKIKTGVKGITKEMLESLKIALQKSDDENGYL
jgi:hypothetical protein